VSLEFAHGAIQWLSADGVSTTYTISGLSFQPKAIRFYWVGLQSASDAASEAVDERRGVGFAVSTSSRRAIGTFSQDTASTSNCGAAARNDCCVCTTNGAGASDGRLDLNAINSDGFQMIVDEAAPANITVFWEAWGGSDISVAVIGDIDEPAATGNQDYTVTGFVAGATDQVVMFAGCQSTAALNTDAATDSGLCVGFASSGSASDNVVIAGNSDDASAAMDTDLYGLSGECLAQIVVAGGNPNARAQLTQFNTDGFRLNWIARGLTNRRSVFLAIKGGQWRAGEFTINLGTVGNTATVSGLPFAPKGVSIISAGVAESTAGTSSTNDRMLFGSGSSTSSRRAMGILDENATASSACEIDTCIEYDAVMASPSTAGALLAAVDIDAVNSDGMRFIVDVAVTGTPWVGYLMFGDAPLEFGIGDPWDWGADDDLGPGSPYPSGYQQADGAPNTHQLDWRWDDDASDDQFLIEATAQSQPVEDFVRSSEVELLFDQAELYDDPVIDLAEAMSPVQAQAPPAEDQPEFTWPSWDEADDDTHEIAVSSDPRGDAPAPDTGTFEDAWPWDENAAEDESPSTELAQDDEAAALERDAAWPEEALDELWAEESAPVVADASAPEQQAIADGWDWPNEDTSLEGPFPGGYQQSDGEQVRIEDTLLDDELADDWWTEQPVADGAAPAEAQPPDDAWDWTGQALEAELALEHSPVGADAAPEPPSQPFDDFALFDVEFAPVAVFEVYQQADADPQAADTAWDWDTLAVDDWWAEQAAVLAADGEPVRRDEPWDWTEIAADELADDSAPVRADAAPADGLPPSDGWDWTDSALEAEAAEEHAPVVADASPQPLPAFESIDELAEDDWSGESVPVGADAAPEAGQPSADAWPWFEESVDDRVDSDEVVAVAEAPAQPLEPEFAQEWLEDEPVLESAPVAESAAAPDDVWPWFDDLAVDDPAQDAGTGENFPDPLLNVEDAWPWFEEIGLDEWQHEHRLPEFEIRESAATRRLVVAGQDRRFAVKGNDRVLIVEGEQRRY